MKTKLFILIIILSIFFINNNIQAQTMDNCSPSPCAQNYGWTEPQTANIIIDGVTAVVHYITRMCGGVFELKILSIDYNNPNISDNPVKINHVIIIELFRTNPMNFPPGYGDSLVYNWKLYQNACWKYTNETHVGIEPCNNECCLLDIWVVNSRDCSRDFQTMSEINYGNCYTVPLDPAECWNVCDFSMDLPVIWYR